MARTPAPAPSDAAMASLAVAFPATASRVVLATVGPNSMIFVGKGESLILSGPNASERRKAAGILQERLAKDEIEWAEVGSICCHGLVTPTYSIAPLTEGSVDIKFYCDEDGKRYVVDIFGCDYFSVIDRRGTGRPRQGVRCQLLRWYVHALRRVRRH